MPRVIASLALLVSSALLLSACADYANQTDTISYGAGYAMKQNMAIHRANPASRYGGATDIWTDGKRAAATLAQPADTRVSPASDIAD